MRLEQLKLDFFGHFTNAHFNFGLPHKSGCDFHVIYGPNEAGKTTIMEAYLRLLYGFPQPEPYRFQHQRKNLRISGTLEIDGQQRHFTRMPTRKNSLRDEHGTIISDGSLQLHLAGLSLVDYRNLLCIDDETIEKGGEEIVNSKGDIGSLLFSAAAGIEDLSGVLEGVNQQADNLYRKSATKTQLAVLKKEYADIEKQIKQLDVPASHYRKLRQAYDLAHAAEQNIEHERKALNVQQLRLEATLSALPLLEEIDVLETKISTFTDYPKRMPILPEELVMLLTSQNEASKDADRLTADIEAMSEALKRAIYEPEHLKLGEALEVLEPLKSLAIAAEHDLDKQLRKSAELFDDMKRTIRDLDVDDEIDPIELIVAPSVLLDFEQVLKDLGEATYGISNEQAEIDRLKETIESLSDVHSELETALPGDPSLIEILERFSSEELSLQYKQAQQLIERAEQDYQSALDAITCKGQRFESIPRCSLNAEEVEELVNDLQVLSNDLESARKESDGYIAEIAASMSQIERIKLIDGLVGDDQAAQLKVERNSDWFTHKGTLSATSADAFEVSMHKLDDAMEARLTHASELGGLRQIEQLLSSHCAKADTIMQRMKDLVAAREVKEQLIADAAVQCGLNDTLSPKAFLTWIRKCERAEPKESLLHLLNTRYCSIFEKADRLSNALSEHVHLDSPDFSELMVEARSIQTRQLAHIEKLRIAKDRLSEAERLMKSRNEKLAKLVDLSATAEANWQMLVNDTFDGRVSADGLRSSLQPLRELRELDKERVAVMRLVSEMELDQAQFAQQVDALAVRVGIENIGSPLETYTMLKQLSEAARTAKHECDSLSIKKLEWTRQLASTDQVLSDISARVKEIGTLFPEVVPTNTVAELRVAVDDALMAIACREQKTLLESELLSKIEADSLADARLQLEALPITEQQAKLREVQAKFEISEEQYKSAIEQRVSCKKELDAVTGDAEVALLDQRKTSLALEMTEVALQYLKLSTGLRLAEEAIRRYRDTHRSGMLQATEAAFAELTNGAYRKLQALPDGSSEMLIAVDNAGTPKQVQDMSKGTRFQLYLALRAAAYEQLCSQGKCLPFVCDDIFETFDEERTRSACHILDRIGHKGQAIYLTHHRHVVDIAQDVCGDRVRIHHII